MKDFKVVRGVYPTMITPYRDGKIDEEAFAALAKEKTEDTGSKEDGGLYPQVVRMFSTPFST